MAPLVEVPLRNSTFMPSTRGLSGTCAGLEAARLVLHVADVD
jgi:hypothetical protein